MDTKENTSSATTSIMTESSESKVLVKERFEINYAQPLINLDSNGAKAFDVKDKINPQRKLFALICDNNFPARLSILSQLKSIDNPNLLKLVDYGVVDYLPEDTMNMALIYQQPLGPKVSEAYSLKKITYERFKSIANSFASACEALKSYKITHRAIRTDNIFFKNDDCSEIILGDCAASFPALYQPLIYETIESSLCLPHGRGNGQNSNDVYASGIVLLALALGHDITTELSEKELFEAKLKNGSYSTLTNREKVNAKYAVIIKNLLEDNIINRWNGMNLYNFLEGKTTPFAGEINENSIRSIIINGEKYYSAKTAALAMLRNPQAALTVIYNGKLLEWIKKGLENEKLSNNIEKLLQSKKDQAVDNSTVAEICILLENSLPIMCGDTFIFPDGISKAIFYYLKNNLPLEGFYSVIAGDTIKLWYQEQPNLHSPLGSNEFKIYISRNGYGYGIYRIIYDFDEDLPCTSPLIGKEFVNSPSKLLKALNKNFSKNALPYDKNIIAYLRCKMGKKISGILTDINSNQDALSISAIIRLYANIQNKSGPVQLIQLATWLKNSAKPIIQNYHNLKYRKYLEQEVNKIVKNGKIIELYELLENEDAKNQDKTEYAEILKKINILLNERQRILNGGTQIDMETKELAIKFGSILSMLTMLSSFVFSIIYWIIK